MAPVTRCIVLKDWSYHEAVSAASSPRTVFFRTKALGWLDDRTSIRPVKIPSHFFQKILFQNKWWEKTERWT